MTKRISLLLSLTLLLCTQGANAAGFALAEQSTSSLGNATAGWAATAEDASTIFMNPAGITRSCGGEVVFAATGIRPHAHFHNRDSILSPLIPPGAVPGPGAPIPGSNGGDAGRWGGVGALYISQQINDCFYVGLAVDSPFGLVTDYHKDWVGRYHALRSQLITIEINPVVAVKLTDTLSVGGGFREMYLHAKLTNAVDYGTIAWLSTLGLPGPAQPVVQGGLTLLGFEPTTQDGHVRVKGNSWGYGGNVGVLWEPCCGTRVGFGWRSQVKHKVKGTEVFSSLPALIADPALAGPLQAFFAGIAAAAATDTKAKSTVTLPDIYSLSAYYELNECWAIMGDITWTRWSTLQRLVFRFDNPLQPDAVTTLKWKNVWKYALGVNYRPDCNWVLRSGIAWDQTPIRNKEYRAPRIPDNNRFWLAFGAGYSLTQCIHFDVAYAHLFIPDPKINKAGFELPEDTVRGGLRGKYKDASADIFSVQAVIDY